MVLVQVQDHLYQDESDGVVVEVGRDERGFDGCTVSCSLCEYRSIGTTGTAACSIITMLSTLDFSLLDLVCCTVSYEPQRRTQC